MKVGSMRIRIPAIRWRKPPEAKVLELLERHVSLCMSISSELVRVAELKIAGSEEETMKCTERLSGMEKEADGLRREIMMELAKGILPPLSREDLMRFTERLDMVADHAKDAARLLSIIRTDELTDGFKIVFMHLVRRVGDCVHALGGSIKALYEDFKRALDECYEVEKIEEEIDVIYTEALRVARDTNMRIQTSLLATELLRLLEMMSDHCEDTADMIRIVVISTLH
ncbi:MAG: hypothetical protein AOA65_1858 [Candidatus Bathyarchaeota archaeon BA1]|nr:MAG: hypothetical protein AOA65_1858 [Candidatus Bathyarchaeota archaeon BA1]